MFLLFLLFQVCRCSDTIIGNEESLKDANEDYLVSNTSKFVLGFFSPENSSNRYVGIWYSQTIVPDKTVVWVANRNNPINDSSGVLKINRYGELALYAYDLENDPIWFTNVSWSVQNVNARNLFAHLLDTGNLVVLQHDRNEKYLWQSFDHPTDNLLPGMKVGMNWKTGQKWELTSWKSQNDPATGDYSMRLYPSQTESPEFFIYKGLSKYYRIDVSTPAVKMLVPIVTNEEETYFFLNTSEMKISAISDTVRSLTWDYGKLRWNEDFSAPKSRCDFYGKCGANSICSPDNLNQFECQCLRGYEPKSISDWNNRNGSGGCVSNQVGFSKCGDEDGFVPVERVKYPDTSIAALSKSGMSAKDCEQECLRNCSCTAYLIFGNEEVGDCLTWYDDLMDILVYAEGGQELHIRVNATLLAEYSGKSQGKVTPATLIVVAVLAMVLLTIMLGCWWRKKNRNTTEHSAGMELEETHRHPELQYFDLDTIIAATNDFSCINELGHGGFGSVYKGKLPNEQIVAVKRLSKTSGQGIKEFQNEVELIAKLQHRNLVKLFGCCIKGDERILVLEYMPNKSLDSFLFDPTKRSLLDWERRFGIINGIARGILYLHQDSRLRIIHRDLKTSNVLLDDEMNPKISDFGMARIFHGNQPQYRTNRIVGTYGYMSPEYAVFGKFSTKLDVFSFGIIMLEIVSGQKNNGSDLEDPSMNLIGHVWKLWNEGRALDIIDPTLRSYQSNEVIRCIQVALLCVQEDSKDRPSMSDVFIMLIGEASPPSPNQPAFVFRRSGADDEPLISNKSSVNDMTITITGAR